MVLPLLLVDAFAEGPFSGNPAAVCLLPKWPADGWLQGVAAEMNQSETAFLVRRGDDFDLRWFTPAVEVELCGHATLASAAALHFLGAVDGQGAIHFHTRSGRLSARERDGVLELDFPQVPSVPAVPPEGLIEALGVRPVAVGRTDFDYLVEVAGAHDVRALGPDFRRLREVDCRGVMVTSRGEDPSCDFVSRFFAPACGIDEDPVTGSAHCTLGPYWSVRLGKTDLVGRQLSRRGGTVGVRLENDRAFLGGKAIVVSRGELLVDPHPAAEGAG